MLNVPALDWIFLDHQADPAVVVGDLVSGDAGGMPIYRVMAIEEDRAWVTTSRGAPAWAMRLESFRWKGRDRQPADRVGSIPTRVEIEG